MAKKTLFTVVVDGFFYVFGLSDNPVESLRDKYKASNDQQAISGYWERVGEDMKKAFDAETQTCE